MGTGLDTLSFGCRLNAYEAEVMKAHALAAGLEDVIIVNTCAVTGEAERQARQAIRKAHRDNPRARIVVTGCAAHMAPDAYASMDGVVRVLSNDDKLKPDAFADIARNDTPASLQPLRPLPPGEDKGFGGRPRAYIQVQTGCDHRCTFCIIPYGRGPSRSRPIQDIIHEASALASIGYREMVLTGVDLTAYGQDLGDRPTLGAMARQVLDAVPGLTRLRFSSLDPIEIDEDVWSLLAHEPRMMPHWHLSLQSGDDMVLKRMKRRHSSGDVLRLVERARTLRPDMMFGADVIAGFPTETDAMFDNTARLIQVAGMTWLHVFPYSARQGTPAAKMPQVPAAVRKQRAAALRAIGDRAIMAHLDSLIGKTVDIFAENPLQGRTNGYAEVTFHTPQKTGAVVTGHITARVDRHAVADVLHLQENP